MTGYVVLPPGHVTMACLQVLPSEVPKENGIDFSLTTSDGTTLASVSTLSWQNKNRNSFINMGQRCFLIGLQR